MELWLQQLRNHTRFILKKRKRRKLLSFLAESAHFDHGFHCGKKLSAHSIRRSKRACERGKWQILQNCRSRHLSRSSSSWAPEEEERRGGDGRRKRLSFGCATSCTLSTIARGRSFVELRRIESLISLCHFVKIIPDGRKIRKKFLSFSTERAIFGLKIILSSTRTSMKRWWTGASAITSCRETVASGPTCWVWIPSCVSRTLSARSALWAAPSTFNATSSRKTSR